MRLLNTLTLELTDFTDTDVPLYAILSHRWGDDEVSLQEMQRHDPRAVDKAGYKKVLAMCKIAASHGFQYAWADTCCIDKTSSAELSEAINSMYRWYQDSTICYTYLGDVTHHPFTKPRPGSDFHKSSWFTRGWTLQELIAPSTVIFFDAAWQEIGTKASLCSTLSHITGIPETILAGESPETASIAQRMSWASSRRATRTEDTAYSLMGLFNVNMPMLYGEGKKAFVRLQEEIIKVSDDHTIFAWGSEFSGSQGDNNDNGGLLATSPADFASCRDMVPCDSRNARSTLSRVIWTDNKGYISNPPPFLTLPSPSTTTNPPNHSTNPPSHQNPPKNQLHPRPNLVRPAHRHPPLRPVQQPRPNPHRHPAVGPLPAARVLRTPPLPPAARAAPGRLP
jgi:hypothetical protein